MTTVFIDRHWCLTEDRTRVVPEDHPDARWLLWRPGDEVPYEDAVKYGIVRPLKSRRPTANKMRKPAQEK